MTNFSAVWVSEKLTTLTSTKPGLLAGGHGLGLGDLAAPLRAHDPDGAVGLDEPDECRNPAKRVPVIDAVEDQIDGTARGRRPARDLLRPLGGLDQKRLVSNRDRRDRHALLDAELVEPRGRTRDALGPLLGRAPDCEVRGRVAELDVQRAIARSRRADRRERDREAHRAAEHQILVLEPGRSSGRFAVELQRAGCIVAHDQLRFKRFRGSRGSRAPAARSPAAPRQPSSSQPSCAS